MPAGEKIASAAESAIEWLVFINSTLKSPSSTVCPYFTSISFEVLSIPCSTSFLLISARVSLVP